jgi:hypothetical protein
MKIQSTVKIFKYYKSLGDQCIERLNFDELKFLPHPESNSVALMIRHMRGNMLSRWTDFLNADGEKEWRNRDSEFVEEYSNKEEIVNQWNEGWDCLFGALETIKQEHEQHIVYIRNEGHTVPEAIERQLAHYAYHVGQMVFLAKLIKGDDWVSLSIPRNASKDYNAGKFDADKGKQHFTDKV